MSNLRLPHWASLLVALSVIVIAWLLQQNNAGNLVLPAVAISALSLIQPILAALSPSAVPSTNAKAALAAGDVMPLSLMAKREEANVVAKAASKIAPLASLLLLVGCHETPQAAIAQTIDLTNAACALASDQPAGQPYVDVVCAIAQGGEQVVSVVIGDLSDGSTTAASMSVPVEQIRIRLPAPSADAFLAKHKGH